MKPTLLPLNWIFYSLTKDGGEYEVVLMRPDDGEKTSFKHSNPLDAYVQAANKAWEIEGE